MDKKKKATTLTIVQDFPKKKIDEMKVNNIEMVQGKTKNIKVEDAENGKKNKLTTLTIV